MRPERPFVLVVDVLADRPPGTGSAEVASKPATMGRPDVLVDGRLAPDRLVVGLDERLIVEGGPQPGQLLVQHSRGGGGRGGVDRRSRSVGRSSMRISR